MATDFVMALLAAGLAARLRDHAKETGFRAVSWWRWAFLATAVGALAGGSSHGFAQFLSAWQWTAVWRVSTLMIGFASFSLLMAISYARLSEGSAKGLRVLAWTKLALYSGWMLQHIDFRFVILEYGTTMVLILMIEIRGLVKTRSPGTGWVCAGILVSFASSAIQQSDFSLHRHFNQNDLFHVIQMAALYFLFRGGMLLRDHQETAVNTGSDKQ